MPRLLSVLSQGLLLLGLKLVQVLEDGLKAAILLEQLRSRLVADARHIRNIVGLVADQRFIIRHKLGAKSIALAHRIHVIHPGL